MWLLRLLNGALFALLPLARTAPTASPQLLPQTLPSSYTLRVPQQPWNGRPLLQLPTTHLLGLENFTVHPPSPGLPVLPIKIPNQELYALRIPSSTDDLTSTPYLAALLPTSNGDPKWAAVGPIFVPDPTSETVGKWPDRCPGGYQCVADAWVIYSATDVSPRRMNLGRLAYGGFNGHWEAVKDAPHGEGWNVYWIAEDAGTGPGVPVGNRIEIDIVPSEEDSGWGA